MSDTLKSQGRRRFLRSAAAATGAVAVTACGGSSDSYTQGLQFALPPDAGASGDEYTLHVDGKAYPLILHDPVTLRTLSEERPKLAAGVGRFGATHFVERMDMPTKALRTHVTRRRAGAQEGTHELVLVHMNVNDMLFEQAFERVASLRDDLGMPTLVQSGWGGVAFHGEMLSPVDTAAAIVYHHPELMARDPKVAATVKAHIYHAQGFSELWSAIASRPETDGGPEAWCQMVVLMDDELGEPLLDEDGVVRYDYKVADDIMELAGIVIREALITTKNDETLRDELWREHEGRANQPAQAAQGGLLGNAAYGVVVNRPGSKGGITVRPSVFDANDRSVRIELVNWFMRYLGVYVTFHDELGQRITLSDDSWSQALPGGAMLNNASLGIPDLLKKVNLTAQDYRAATFVGSPTTVFGAPVAPGYREFFVKMPPQARSVTVGLGSLGLGLFTNEETVKQEFIGSACTMIVNLAIPLMLLATFIGAESNQEEKDLMEAGEWVNVTLVILSLLGLGKDLISPSTPESREAALVDFGAGSAKLFVKLGDKAARILLNPGMAKFYRLILTRIGLANAKLAIPFLGWAYRALSVTATVAQLVQTIAEVSSSDASADARISLTLNAQMEINPDLDNPAGLPARATSYAYKVTVPGSDTYDSGIQIIDGTTARLTVRADRLPSGGTARFSVVFYGADGREIVARGEAAIYGVTRDRLYSFVTNGSALDITRRHAIADQVFAALGGQQYTTTTQLRDALRSVLPIGDFDACLRGLVEALASHDIPLLVPAGKTWLEVECTIVENLVALTTGTRYQHDRVLQYTDGKYAWKQTTVAPAASAARCDNSGRSLCELPSITLSRRTGDLGYAWRTASTGLTVCGGGTANTQAYTVQNISISPDPNLNRKTLTLGGAACGVVEGAGVYYQFDGASDGSGVHFLLDGRAGQGNALRVRPLLLSDTDAFELSSKNRHYGSFSELPTSLCWHPSGFLIGVNRARHKMEILDLNEGLIEDKFTRHAELAAGLGTRFGLLNGPSCVAARFDGVVLVLESVARRIQAFDVRGLPVPAFRLNSTPVFALRDYGGRETYLDMSVEARGFVYVLSHLGDGTQSADYNLDIYTPDGDLLANTNGFTAARLIVDYWRNLHTLNWESMVGLNGRTEPTVSRWIPA